MENYQFIGLLLTLFGFIWSVRTESKQLRGVIDANEKNLRGVIDANEKSLRAVIDANAKESTKKYKRKSKTSTENYANYKKGVENNGLDAICNIYDNKHSIYSDSMAMEQVRIK